MINPVFFSFSEKTEKVRLILPHTAEPEYCDQFTAIFRILTTLYFNNVDLDYLLLRSKVHGELCLF